MTEKGIEKEKAKFGTFFDHPQILDMSDIATGRVQYARGVKGSAPLRP
jgi:hypothetical protein